MFCYKCGKSRDDNAKFCKECGSVLSTYISCNNMKNQNTDMKRLYRGCLSILSGVLIFVFLTASLASLVIRDSMKPSKTEKVFKQVNITDILDDINFDFSFFSIDRIDEDETKALIENTELCEYLAGVVNGYTEFMLGGPEPEGIQGKKVASIMRKNDTYIEKEFGYDFAEWEFDYIEEKIEENRELKNIHRKEEGFVIVRVLLSPYLLALMIIMLILCIIISFVLGTDKIKTLRNTGIIFVSASILIMVAFVVAKIGCMLVFYGSIGLAADGFLSGVILSACIIAGITFLIGIVSVFIAHITAVSKAKALSDQSAE